MTFIETIFGAKDHLLGVDHFNERFYGIKVKQECIQR